MNKLPIHIKRKRDYQKELWEFCLFYEDMVE